MEPTLSINYLAIAACVVFSMVFGFVWFGPVLGKKWAEHMGMEDMEAGNMNMSLLLFAVSSFLIAFVFAHTLAVWRASAWGLSPDVDNLTLAWNSAFFTWIGFFLPFQLGRVAWEKRKWGLVVINSGFDLIRITVFGFILAYWT